MLQLTKITDFGGNYRLPAGMGEADITNILIEGDTRLIKIFFTEDTCGFLRGIAAGRRPIQTLIDGYHILPAWRTISVPFIAANATFNILPREEIAKKSSNFSYIYSLLRDYHEALSKIMTQSLNDIGYVQSIVPTKIKILSNFFAMFIDEGQNIWVDNYLLPITNFDYDNKVITVENLVFLPQLGQRVKLKNENIKIKEYEKIANFIC